MAYELFTDEWVIRLNGHVIARYPEEQFNEAWAHADRQERYTPNARVSLDKEMSSVARLTEDEQTEPVQAEQDAQSTTDAWYAEQAQQRANVEQCNILVVRDTTTNESLAAFPHFQPHHHHKHTALARVIVEPKVPDCQSCTTCYTVDRLVLTYTR